MNFRQFENLGDELYRAFSARRFDEQAFPALAAELLARAELEPDFQFGELVEFLMNTRIRQQPSLGFSNLPLVVYRRDDFHIELLIWTEATTTIHQHGFSGAFRVLIGSTLHGSTNSVSMSVSIRNCF